MSEQEEEVLFFNFNIKIKQMVKDVIIQMLNSPEWSNTYDHLVYQYCIHFDEDTTHTMDQNDIFKQFQKQMAAIYDNFFNQLGMNDENIEKIQQNVIKQMINEKKNLDIQQLLAIMDFNVFKAEMAKANKLLELEALHEIQADLQQQNLDDLDEDDEEEEEDNFMPEYEQLEDQLNDENMEEEINLQLAILLSLDQPDEQKIEELNKQKEDLQNKINLKKQEKQVDTQTKPQEQQVNISHQQQLFYQKSILEEKLPQLQQQQTPNQQKQKTADNMGFSVSDNQQELGCFEPVDTNKDNLEKMKKNLIQKKTQKLKEKIENNIDQNIAQAQNDPIKKEELEKRKKKFGAIKKALANDDD